MDKVNGFIRLMRLINCAMMGFAVFVGAVLADPQFFNAAWLGVLYGFLTGFMLTAASMTINDYYDRAIDAINEPSRPIPSGMVGAQEALFFVFVLSAVGFVFAYLTSVLCLVVAIVSWVVVVTYVTVGKRSGLPGNLLVSTCVAIPFIYGSIIVLSQVPLSVLLFTLMAFLSNTGREITKGIVFNPSSLDSELGFFLVYPHCTSDGHRARRVFRSSAKGLFSGKRQKNQEPDSLMVRHRLISVRLWRPHVE
jgi:geranylgeranylglycerol-phosphate geranylgeranyltransferase